MKAVWLVPVAVVLGAVTWSMLRMAEKGEASVQRECLSRLGRLGGAIQIYAADHDGRLMPAEVWATAVAPYAGSTEALRCPAVDRFGYAFNKDLGSAEIKRISAPEREPTVFDWPTLVDNAHGAPAEFLKEPRHGIETSVLFLDGHVGNLDPYGGEHAPPR